MVPTATAKPRRWPFALFLLFLLAYNAFRVALFAATQTGALTSDRPLDPTMNAIIAYSELAIGLVGLIVIPGLVGFTAWGFWVTTGVNAYAILFDAAAAVSVQLSAAGGVVPPLVILILLLVFRRRFFPAQSEPALCAPAQA